MELIKVPHPFKKEPDMEVLNREFRSMEAEYSKQAAEALKEPVELQPTPQPVDEAILDIEIYVPYQAAIDSFLDDTFEDQPIMVQALQGWMAEAFRRFAQKKKSYQNIVLTCARKIQLKDMGKPFGQVIPKEHRPSPSHIFKTLVKLKQLHKPHVKGEVDYYVVSEFPERLKKEYFYPTIDEALPGLMTYLKKNKVKLLLGNDFVFALPLSLRDHPEFKEAWDLMEVTHIDEEGYAIHKATTLHLFKFI